MRTATNKLILNSTQIPNILLDEWMAKLSSTEFKIVMIIARQTYGWHKDSDAISYTQLKVKTGASNGSIGASLKTLREKGLILVEDEQGNILKSKEECRGKILYYRINATSPNSGDHLSKNRTPKIGDTKETNTKASSYEEGRIKHPSCPLLNGSPLKDKYPNGHSECVEFIQSEEKDRQRKFINLPKQYNHIHKILRAGYGFDTMNRTLRVVEKKYGPGSWDFATIANWIEKGAL